MHLGGDEVIQSCFNEAPGIQDFLKQHNLKNYSELIVYHINKVRSKLSEINDKKSAIYWSDEATFAYTYKPNDIL